jgi:hypothetical protein
MLELKIQTLIDFISRMVYNGNALRSNVSERRHLINPVKTVIRLIEDQTD